MRLVEVAGDNDRVIQGLKAELRDMQFQGNFLQGPVPSHYRNAVTRIERAIAEREKELQDRIQRSGREKQVRDLAKSTEQVTSQPMTRERHNRNIGDGIKSTYELLRQHGGWKGLAKQVEKYVRDASEHGTKKVTTDDIVTHFNFNSNRSVDRWIERPEFRSVARMLNRFH